MLAHKVWEVVNPLTAKSSRVEKEMDTFSKNGASSQVKLKMMI